MVYADKIHKIISSNRYLPSKQMEKLLEYISLRYEYYYSQE